MLATILFSIDISTVFINLVMLSIKDYTHLKGFFCHMHQHVLYNQVLFWLYM